MQAPVPPGCGYGCQARALYARWVDTTNCAPSARSGKALRVVKNLDLERLCLHNWMFPKVDGPGLTKKSIQNGGTVLFCGGAMLLTFAGAPATGGGTVYAGGLLGGAACGWAAWVQHDPGK